jgi:hypothetical protein
LQDDDSDFLCPFASDLFGSLLKGKCGGAFYFCCICLKKKIKNKTKEESSSRKKKENEKKKVEKKRVFSFNKRLEENKKVVSVIASV